MIAVEWLADSTVISSAVTSIPCPSSDRAVGEEVAQQEVPKKENLENLSVAVEKCSDQTTEEAVKQGMSEKMGEAKDKRIIGCEGLATGEEIVERELPKKGNPESKSGTVVDCSAQMTEEPVKQGISEKIGEAKDKRIIPQFIPEMNEWWEKQKKRCRGILTISIYPPPLPTSSTATIRSCAHLKAVVNHGLRVVLPLLFDLVRFREPAHFRLKTQTRNERSGGRYRFCDCKWSDFVR